MQIQEWKCKCGFSTTMKWKAVVHICKLEGKLGTRETSECNKRRDAQQAQGQSTQEECYG